MQRWAGKWAGNAVADLHSRDTAWYAIFWNPGCNVTNVFRDFKYIYIVKEEQRCLYYKLLK